MEGLKRPLGFVVVVLFLLFLLFSFPPPPPFPFFQGVGVRRGCIPGHARPSLVFALWAPRARPTSPMGSGVWKRSTLLPTSSPRPSPELLWAPAASRRLSSRGPGLPHLPPPVAFTWLVWPLSLWVWSTFKNMRAMGPGLTRNSAVLGSRAASHLSL